MPYRIEPSVQLRCLTAGCRSANPADDADLKALNAQIRAEAGQVLHACETEEWIDREERKKRLVEELRQTLHSEFACL